MRWINSLERRFGFLAIPGLIRVIVALNALVFLMLWSKPDFVELLTLNREKVLGGEVWRLLSYVFIPLVNIQSQLSFIWVLFYLSMLWLMGEGLEQAWGSFKLNLFYLVGMLGTTVAVLLLGANDATGVWLNTSLFFAFATLFPNFPILLFFIIPVRVKWIALISFGFVLLEFVFGSLSTKAAVVVSLANYIIFFGPEWVRQWREQGRTLKRRQEFQVVQAASKNGEQETLHHCKVCGNTEVSAPEKEFRVAADGEEYCTVHLPSRQGPVGSPPPLPQTASVEKE